MSKNRSGWLSKEVFGWALYDWANSAFATTVMAGFFPVFFKSYWSSGVDPLDSTALLGLANSMAGILIALSAPFLGALADLGAIKKKLLAIFTLVGALATISLFFIEAGGWQKAILFYLVATTGFSGALIFYDALLKLVAKDDNKLDQVSSFGYALGYLGGGVLFAFNVLMTLKPELFGLLDKSEGVKWSFVSVGLWWVLFSLPLFFWVKEGKKDAANLSYRQLLKKSSKNLLSTFKEIRQSKHIFIFLLAYWLYIDGVDTIIRMAVDYGMSLGLDSTGLISALLLTQFVGFPAALFFGWFGHKIGTKRGIFVAIGTYIGITVWAAFMSSLVEFYLIAAIVGLVQGGIQALSRSYYAMMIPQEKAAEYFGFYNMLGKFAAIIGPTLMGISGIVVLKMGVAKELAPRFGIISIAFLFIGGTILLSRVKWKKS